MLSLLRKTPVSLVSRCSSSTANQQRSMATRVVLASRPQVNCAVTTDNFRVESIPDAELPHASRDSTAATTADATASSSSGVIAETLYLSIDPFLRCRFNEDTGVEYTKPYQVGKPISSAGIGRVVEAWGELSEKYKEGDIIVEAFDSWPWQDTVAFDNTTAASLTKVPAEMALLCPLTFTLGCVGQTGVSAYFGILGEVDPSPQDVVVISGAAGSVGTVVGQLAKARGSRVVGICGSSDKCDVLRMQLGFDAAVNYKNKDFPSILKAAVGIGGCSIYFDNVGGSVTDTVAPLMRDNGHIVLCGQIATYDSDIPYPPPLPEHTQVVADAKGVTRTRYLVLNYKERFNEALKHLLTSAASGALIGKETLESGGLKRAPNAFVGMMAGGNIGKQLVQVNPIPKRLAAYNTTRKFLPGWLRGLVAETIKL